MKTIFITSFNPFVTRNILFTNVFTMLQSRSDIRLVIFCPDYKKKYFKENFGRPNVIVEGVPSQRVGRHDVIFRYLAGSLIDTRTRYIHQRRELSRNKRYFRFLVSRTLAKLGRLNIAKKIARFFDFKLMDKGLFDEFFKKYKPQFVFAADIFHNDDIHFLSSAKARGVKTAGMVRSWDNITNKGLFRVKPGLLIVNNELAKDEAIEYGDMKKESIAVVGMPQFDAYVNEPRTSREDFFKRINLNPKKRLILFSPHGNRFHDTDWHIMQILKDARLAGEIPADIQILVRFPPNDDVSLGTFEVDEHFAIDKPGHIFHEDIFADRELDIAAARHLADSVAHCDILITYNSSMIIDAAAFDKPIIGVAFDGFIKNRDHFESVGRFMDYTHTEYVLRTGGVWVVRSREELIKAVNIYLKNPSYKKEGRAEILKTQSGLFDGKSGERLARVLLDGLQ